MRHGWHQVAQKSTTTTRPFKFESGSLLPSSPLMVNCIGSVAGGVGIHRLELGRPLLDLSGSAIIGRENQVAEPFLGPMHFAIHLAQLAAVFGTIRFGCARIGDGECVAETGARVFQ